MGAFDRMEQVTVLYSEVPPSANVLKRKYRNPHAYKRLRDGWQRMSWALVQGRDRSWLMAMAHLKKKMRIDVTLQHSRLYDHDNAYSSVKILIDGLVNLGFLAKDDPQYLDLEVHQQKIRANSTVLVIREAQLHGPKGE